MMRTRVLMPAILTVALLPCRAQSVRAQPNDQLSVVGIEALELSPDGRQLLYVRNETNAQTSGSSRTIWRMPTAGGAPVRFGEHDALMSPQWSPDGTSIAAVCIREKLPQLCLTDSDGGNASQLTSLPRCVVAFKWSPSGEHVALLTKEEANSVYAREIQDPNKGVVIRKWDFHVYRLLRNQLFQEFETPSRLYLLTVKSKQVEKLATGPEVSGFAWAPNGRSLAVVTRTDTAYVGQRSDILVYDLTTRTSRVALEGRGGKDWTGTVSYADPVWSPDSKRLAFLYRDHRDRWQVIPRLGVYTLADSKTKYITGADGPEFYAAKLWWLKDDEIYCESTVNASRHLYSISVANGAVKQLGTRKDYESGFAFSKDGNAAAFVLENPAKAPEIHYSTKPFTATRELTSLNVHIERSRLPIVEEIRWTSADGVQVQGWLMTPRGFDRKQRYPLLVMVHGGPRAVVANRFDLYSPWPYPFRMFVERGYLVFFPNYRGTGSFGKRFMTPRELDKEPVDDIVSGVAYLQKQGFVDEKLIGIMGQSHGAWLGPLVMARKRIFKAASFAEGGADEFSAYGSMPGWLNLNVHEYYKGGPPYQDPKRYIELSPMFGFGGLHTATLLEYGEESLATEGLHFVSSLWRNGVPHEMVIYPKTGHNIYSPRLMLESIERNLDWFDYWMLGKKDANPSKQDQYKRWEQIVDEMKEMRQRQGSR